MLIVNDPDFEHRLIESALSSSVWQRARAAVVLRYIPGKASRRVLADLFNDTEVAVVRGSSGRELALRPVRTLACMALGRMKEVPPEEACWDVLLDPGVDLIDYTYKRSRPISDQLLKTR
jgi:hypothetical protein